MKESQLLAIKFALGQFGLLDVGEAVIRSVTPSGKRFRAHRQRLIDFYRQFVAPGDLCFDVGANLGSRVDVFLACGARVVAIEPQENCLRYLRLRYGRTQNVILIPQGLGDTEGQVEMLINREDTATSSMAPDRIASVSAARHIARDQWDRTATVRVTTLDSLIAAYGRPAFCKIDVEGFEDQVLKGLSTPIKALSFEYTPEYRESALNCIRRLAALGSFTFNYSCAEDMIFAMPGWVDAAAMLRVMTEIPVEQPAGDVYARFEGDR